MVQSSSTSQPKKVKGHIHYQRPWLYAKQEKAIFHPKDVNGKLARFSYIEAGTKTGKTVGCIAWLFEQALFGKKKGQNYWWVAPVYQQAKIAFTRMKNAYPDGTFKVNESELVLTLKLVGTIITFKSAEKPDNLYGEDVYAAVFDEASRGREEAWWALRSTLTATRGPVRFIGNVKGRKNWFYAGARRAEAGEPGSAYFKIVAADAVKAGVLAASEIESAKRDLPEQVFRELYLAEASDDGGNPFGLKAIEECVDALSTKPPVVWGWDLAKSVDYTVGIGLDEDGKTCRFERWQKKPWDETIDQIIKITDGLPALVDSTGVGDPIVELLQKRAPGVFTGYTFTSASKQKLMEGLAVAIQSKATTFPDGPIKIELDVFEYEYTRTGVHYTAPEGSHDDCVCALALATEHRTVAKAPLFALQDVLNDTQAVPFPTYCDVVYATMHSSAKTGKPGNTAAVVYWARSQFVGTPLTILGWGLVEVDGPMIGVWLSEVDKKLKRLAAETNSAAGSIGTYVEDKASGSILLRHAESQGLHMQPLEEKLVALGIDERAINASGYVSSHKVKFSAPAIEYIQEHNGVTQNHMLAQVKGFRAGSAAMDNELLQCFTYGVAVGLGGGDGI